MKKVCEVIGAIVLCICWLAFWMVIGITIGHGIHYFTTKDYSYSRTEPWITKTEKYTMFNIPKKCWVAVDNQTNEVIIMGPCELSETSKSFIRNTKPKS